MATSKPRWYSISASAVGLLWLHNRTALVVRQANREPDFGSVVGSLGKEVKKIEELHIFRHR